MIYINKLKSLWDKYAEQNDILKKGLGGYYNILLWHVPVALSLIIFLLAYLFHLSLNKIFSNLIAIMPSLTGFLIASATILVAIENVKLNEAVEGNINISYKQLGGAIFLYSTKLALLLLLLAFLHLIKSQLL